ncbi:putative amino acid permease [Delitschia confertaspora ATCC 74209]|uniref:Amino acid permease n=1 Tax=Delitschia confertaspora ATCC 74209 TaxID=1513339 RepID=A0A9P4MZU9_9PLEO|nr:putative amino acid permease [Delitschia confertaspora ATCC 74209]
MGKFKKDSQTGLRPGTYTDTLNSSETTGRNSDEHKIAQYGKRQQFKRNFGLLSVVSLASTITVLFNGGPTGIITTFPIIFLGVLFQTLVLSELASMIPLSGGQYNWVAILAPPKLSHFLSYLTGWITTITWQSAVPAVTYMCSNMIVALVDFHYPNQTLKNWHATLIFFAVTFVAVFINTYLGRVFPTIECFSFLLHVFGFFVVLIVMVYLAPKAPPSSVFENYINGGGFSSTAVSVFVGTIPIMFGFVGFDSAAHIAEEIGNATLVIPRAMLMTVVLYFVMSYGIVIAMVFCMPVEEVLTSTYTFPIIGVFATVTQSTAGTVIMTSLIIVMLGCGAIGDMAAASRTLWAFAREDGVPFSSRISKIDPRTCLPLYSIGVTATISIALSLIALGSTATFNALSGLAVAGSYSSFIMAASVTLWRRLTTSSEKMPWGPFRLGKLGVPITVFALLYSWVGLIFSFWPPVAHVSIKTFNWSLVVYLGVMILAIVWWCVRAKKTYTGPKMEISSHQWMELFGEMK